jgi:hypothetical protein
MAWKGSTTASAGTATEVSARNLQSPQNKEMQKTTGVKRRNDHSLTSNFIAMFLPLIVTASELK